jgi:hydrogenase/urease accessory protein HupE
MDIRNYLTLHRFIALVISCLGLLALPYSAHAHEIRPALVDLHLDKNNAYTLTLRLNLEAVMAEIGPQHSDTSESANANRYNTLRALPSQELQSAFEAYKQTFLRGLFLKSDQGALTPAIVSVSIPPVGDTELARDTSISLSGTLPANANNLSWGMQTSFGANALRVSTSDKQDIYTVYLQPGKSSDIIPLAGVVSQSSWQVFNNYVVIGFQHILPKGLDHILFVVGLFLLSLKMSTLLWQITSFTIAHSVTLALGILGVVNISADIVEPLIALSIVYVCVENILSDKLHSWRPVIIFSFGLLHGLGFASVLTEIGLSSNYFISGLIAFNLGLELGQLAVIVICFFGMAIWFRHKSWYRSRITVPASGVIALIGMYWFIERAFF